MGNRSKRLTFLVVACAGAAAFLGLKWTALALAALAVGISIGSWSERRAPVPALSHR